MKKDINILPEALQGANFINSLRQNKRNLKHANEVPVLLRSNPPEMQRHVMGNLNALRDAERNKGELLSMASRLGATDWQNYLAGNLTANAQADQYMRQGFSQDDAAKRTFAEQVFNQSEQNAINRYNTAETNRGNLFNRQVQRISDKAIYDRLNYESLTNLLSSATVQTAAKRDERKQIQDNLDQYNYINMISADPAKYGVTLTDEEQRLYDQYNDDNLSYNNMSQEEKERLAQAKAKIEEKAIEMLYKGKGYRYIEAPTNTNPTLNIAPVAGQSSTPIVKTSKKGGTIDHDYLIEIEKVRTKVKNMQMLQRGIEKRLDALEKDLSRTQIGMTNYVRGQMHTKKVGL